MKELIITLGIGFATLLIMPGSLVLLGYIISTITTIDLTSVVYSVMMTLILCYSLGFTIRRFKK